MLILTRKCGESITIGDNQEVIVTICNISRGQVKLSIKAPSDTLIFRKELIGRKGIVEEFRKKMSKKEF